MERLTDSELQEALELYYKNYWRFANGAGIRLERNMIIVPTSGEQYPVIVRIWDIIRELRQRLAEKESEICKLKQ
jgi:hypothetical protein